MGEPWWFPRVVPTVEGSNPSRPMRCGCWVPLSREVAILRGPAAALGSFAEPAQVSPRRNVRSLRVCAAVLLFAVAGSASLVLAASTSSPTGLLLQRADVPTFFKHFRTTTASVPEFGLGLPDLAKTPCAESLWFTGEVDNSEQLLSVAFVLPTATAAHRLFRALVGAPCGQNRYDQRRVSTARVGDESLVYRLKDPPPPPNGGMWCGFWRDAAVVAFILYWDKRSVDAPKSQPRLGGTHLLPLMRKQQVRIRASH